MAKAKYRKKEVIADRAVARKYNDNSSLRTVAIRGTDHHMRSEIDVWAARNLYRFNARDQMLKAITVTYERKEQSTLTADQRQRFISAFTTANSVGIYGPLVGIHSNHQFRMHGNDGVVGGFRFLPWHRVYLYQLENALQKFDPEFTIPYWDWTKNREFPEWLQDFMPTVIAPDFSNGSGTERTIQVTRTIGMFGRLPTDREVNNLFNIDDFVTFENQLEAPIHGSVHNWVGGTMASLRTAPADPVFWMHHANIDRIWNDWQKKNPGINPPLQNGDEIMDPWTNFSEADTRDTLNFHYVYK